MKKIRIKLTSFDKQLLLKAAERIVKGVAPTGAVVSGPIPLKRKEEIFTVLRSPFVNKNSREQFIQCTHRRLIDIYPPLVATKTIDVLTKLELPSGVHAIIKA